MGQAASQEEEQEPLPPLEPQSQAQVYLLGIRSPGTQEPLPPQWSVYVLTSSLVDRLQRAHNPDASSTQSPLEFLEQMIQIPHQPPPAPRHSMTTRSRARGQAATATANQTQPQPSLDFASLFEQTMGISAENPAPRSRRTEQQPPPAPSFPQEYQHFPQDPSHGPPSPGLGGMGALDLIIPLLIAQTLGMPALPPGFPLPPAPLDEHQPAPLSMGQRLRGQVPPRRRLFGNAVSSRRQGASAAAASGSAFDEPRSSRGLGGLDAGAGGRSNGNTRAGGRSNGNTSASSNVNTSASGRASGNTSASSNVTTRASGRSNGNASANGRSNVNASANGRSNANTSASRNSRNNAGRPSSSSSSIPDGRSTNLDPLNPDQEEDNGAGSIFQLISRLAGATPGPPRNANQTDISTQFPSFLFKGAAATAESKDAGGSTTRKRKRRGDDDGAAASKTSKSQKFEEKLDDRCHVCLAEYKPGDPVRRLGCGHAYHADCIDRWVSGFVNSCPTCRQPVVEVTEEPGPSENDIPASAGVGISALLNSMMAGPGGGLAGPSGAMGFVIVIGRREGEV